MPSVDDLLKKNMEKLEKLSSGAQRKKIVREGPTRPWQVNLPQYAVANTEGIPPSSPYASQNNLGNISKQEITENNDATSPDDRKLSSGQVESKKEQLLVGPEADRNPLRGNPSSSHFLDDSHLNEREVTSSAMKGLDIPKGLLEEEFKPNSEQSTNKPRTNSEQTPNKVRANSEQDIRKSAKKDAKSNRTQLYSEQTPNIHQTKSEQIANNTRTKSEQTPNELRTEVRTELRANSEQTPNINRLQLDASRRLSSLVGLRRSIVLFIYEACKSARSKTTDPIALVNLATACGSTNETAEVTLRRLAKEGFIRKVQSKFGKGGWTIYELPDALHQELLYLESAGKLRTNTEQTPNKIRTELRTELRTSPSSSSRILNTYKTTTEEVESNGIIQLPEEWREIDYSCLESYRFTENHLIQVYQSGKVSPEVVQESIYEMHHDLTVNHNKSLRNPRNVLLSLLKKGTPYTSPGYEPEYLKIERRCLEEQKKRQSDLMQIREESKRLNNLPAELDKEAQFKTWLSQTTAQQRREIAPMAQTEGSEMQLGILRSYWESNLATDPKPNIEDSPEWIRQQIDVSLGLTRSEE